MKGTEIDNVEVQTLTLVMERDEYLVLERVSQIFAQSSLSEGKKTCFAQVML